MKCPYRPAKWTSPPGTEFGECYKTDCMAYDPKVEPPCHMMRSNKMDSRSLEEMKRVKMLLDEAEKKGL